MYLDLLSRVSLTVAASRRVCDTLPVIVKGLTEEVGFALARIWLVEGSGTTKELRLQASAGRSVSGKEWNQLNGRFARFAMGERKIGWVAAQGKAVLIENLDGDSAWIADREWAKAEHLVSCAAHPLVYQGEVLGVLGVFSRQRLSLLEMEGLRPFADHAAVSLANSRANDELEALRSKLELEKDYLQEEIEQVHSFGEIVGKSEALRRILQQVELVAPTEAAVLILGESGTGKELIARAIHSRSRRKDRTLVKVNCASIPRELFESEFFGHVKGSFTGAVKDRVGRFQLADRGSLFLDEVGEIPLDLQSKLLRVLQEGEFERVGEDSTRKVNVRLIAATNRNLGEEAQQHRFREDLYYRLSVFPIVVPPLRQRKEDVPLLAMHFAEAAARRMGLPAVALSNRQAEQLSAYDWPGNIRELQHVTERAVILGRGERLVFELGTATPAPTAPTEEKILTVEEMKALEAANYRRALAKAQGQIYGPEGAAKLLGLAPTTLASRLKTLGIATKS
ncbi:MAG: sigma 54-interacting transcriptional regulator [Bryobacter sp.]|nr:sigma 54-interacting transcriptional regulator [Bryobacter sp.]